MEGGAVGRKAWWRVALWRKKARMAIAGGRQYHDSGQRREEAATSVLVGEKRRAAKHQESSDPQ